MFNAIWKRIANSKYVTKADVRLYRSWALYKSRNGSAACDHMQRPWGDVGDMFGGARTMCGWGVAQMNAATAFGFRRPIIYQPGAIVGAALDAMSRIGCPICYDVLHDISTWINLWDKKGSSRLRYSFAYHLQWSDSLKREAACGLDCGVREDSGVFPSFPLPMTPAEWTQADFEQSVSLGKIAIGQVCPICLAIHGRLYGVDRPEYRFTKFQTLDEAREQAKREEMTYRP